MSHSLPPKGGIPEGRYVNTLPLRKMEGSVLDDAVNSLLRGVSISDSLPISDRNMILANKVDILTYNKTISKGVVLLILLSSKIGYTAGVATCGIIRSSTVDLYLYSYSKTVLR